MSNVTTGPATADRWQDLQTVLGDIAEARRCQCTWPMLTSQQWRSTGLETRRESLHHEVNRSVERMPAPGIIGYVDGEPAGWVRVGPRIAQLRIMNSRIMKAGTTEPLDATSVWAVSCFSIRPAFRRHGLAKVLLHAAVAYAKGHGCDIVEGYPVDGRRIVDSSSASFVGSLSTFEHEGFTITARPTPTRTVVSLNLLQP